MSVTRCLFFGFPTRFRISYGVTWGYCIPIEISMFAVNGRISPGGVCLHALFVCVPVENLKCYFPVLAGEKLRGDAVSIAAVMYSVFVVLLVFSK